MDVDQSSQRPRSNTAVPDEIYNHPSGQRSALLVQLSVELGSDTIPAPFWACLQVCDISQLRFLVDTARSSPLWISLLAEPCASLPLKWMQRVPKDSSRTSNSSASTTPSRRTRPSGPKSLAIERDGNACVLTKESQYQVAHIFPHCLINPRPTTLLENSIPDFWKLLQFFWTPDHLNKWRAELFRDPEDPDKAFDACFNVFCLRDDLHTRWGKAHFALRPVSLSDDEKTLTVELYWQPKADHSFRDNVPIFKVPASSKDLQGYENDRLGFFVDGSLVCIKSGQTFTLTTHDPSTHPLPSFTLLEMQWHLTRIVSMSGAAELYDEVNYNDDDDDNDAPDAAEARPASKTEIIKWVRSVTSSSSSSSPSDDDDDNDDNDDDKPHYCVPTSADVFPLKTRDTREHGGSAQTENVS